MAQNEFSAEEQKAFNALILEQATPSQAKKMLQKQGIPLNNPKLAQEHLEDKALYLYNKDHALGRILESTERVSAEFEDLVYRTRKLLDFLEQEGDVYKQVVVLQQLSNLISLALKVQGKLTDNIASIHAKNINVFSPADMSEMFRKAQETWFSDMDAEYTNGEFILHNPSPELIDDFNKWRAKQVRLAQKAEVDAE